MVVDVAVVVVVVVDVAFAVLAVQFFVDVAVVVVATSKANIDWEFYQENDLNPGHPGHAADGDDEDVDENADKNQYFHVHDAEPPTNYDDPYSTLPPKVSLRLD